LKTVLEKIETLSNNYDKLENQTYLLNEKLSENPFFKNGGKNINLGHTNSDGEDLSFELKSFEKKVMKKFEFVDERIKIFEEDLGRIRNEIFAIKNNSENTNRNFESVKSEMDSFDFRINEANKALKFQEDRKLSLTIFEEKMKIQNKAYDMKIEEYLFI